MMTTATQTQAPTKTRIKRGELVQKLLALKGATFIGLLTDTDPRLQKGGGRNGKPANPWYKAGVRKVSRVNICVNFQYDAGVLRRLKKEGKNPDDFERGESWHQPIMRADGTMTPLSQHKKKPDRLYVRCMMLNADSRFVLPNGEEIDRADLETWLPARSEYKNQGLDKPLIFTVYGVDNIVEATFNEVTYVITD
jgi:hypothetical protein